MNTKIKELKVKLAELQKEIEELEREESKYFDISRNLGWSLGDRWDESCGVFSTSISVRNNSNFKHKGFYLSDHYNWEIIRDLSGYLVLVPTKKINL